nr:immunoglobulin light chain junction region [Macaca mulatta]MOY08457.1 immunoglobulin light chain junction region [Macaca mulatta]
DYYCMIWHNYAWVF